jgi:hypothetical protein
MTGIAIVFLILSAVIIWGGLLAAVIFLARRPEISEYPAGGDDLPGEELDE